MSATDWTLRCPHGHADIRKRNGGNATLRGQRKVPDKGYKSEYYCETCRRYPEHYESPHYEKEDIRRTPKTDRQLRNGYVWSPSHDE
jgi:hypothetical protein